MPRWINMRDELRRLIYGDMRTKPQGYWVVLRIMRIGSYSQYWNEDIQESIGGPKYLYDDILVRTISKPGTSLSSAPIMKQGYAMLQEGVGYEDTDSYVFAMEYEPRIGRLPNQEDILYEVAQHQRLQRPVPPLSVTSRYKILNVVPVYGDFGQVEIVFILGTRVHGES